MMLGTSLHASGVVSPTAKPLICVSVYEIKAVCIDLLLTTTADRARTAKVGESGGSSGRGSLEAFSANTLSVAWFMREAVALEHRDS